MNEHEHLRDKMLAYPLTAAWVAVSAWTTLVVAIMEAK